MVEDKDVTILGLGVLSGLCILMYFVIASDLESERLYEEKYSVFCEEFCSSSGYNESKPHHYNDDEIYCWCMRNDCGFSGNYSYNCKQTKELFKNILYYNSSGEP